MLRRLLRTLLRTVVISLLTTCIFLVSCQSRLIYHPRGYRAAVTRFAEKEGYQPLVYHTSQGQQKAWYLPPADGVVPQRLWLAFAGNGSVALDWSVFTRSWNRQHTGFLLIDYPHYGDCEGRPTPAHIRESSLAAVQQLAVQLKTTPEVLTHDLAVLGHSLGCAAALMAAEDLKAQRAVLIAPFTTMTAMARTVVGWPLCYLNHHTFDNRSPIKTIAARGARITVFHGTDDEVIPLAMSRELQALAPNAITLTEVPGADHNDILSMAAKPITAAINAP